MRCNKALLLGDIDDLKDIEVDEIYQYKDACGIKYENKKWDEIKKVIESKEIDTIISSKSNINTVSRLLWECNCLKQYCLTDTANSLCIETINERANALMWDLIAKQSNKVSERNRIVQTGWKSSFTGDYFSEEEMNEYSKNTFFKLERYLNKEITVLEIGVASGITCFEIAPYVKKYIGIDISEETLKCTYEEIKRKKINNVDLLQGDAGNIDELQLQDKFDIVIINSVAQYFPGYNYFINVISSLLKYMCNKGIIYVGDILDLSKRKIFQDELVKNNRKSNKNDLYYSRQFMEEVPAFVKEISDVEISEKYGKIKNELSLYRYDVMFYVNKNQINQIQSTKKFFAIG